MNNQTKKATRMTPDRTFDKSGIQKVETMKFRRLEIVVFGSAADFASDLISELYSFGKVHWVKSERCLSFIVQAVHADLLIISDKKDSECRAICRQLKEISVLKNLRVALCSANQMIQNHAAGFNIRWHPNWA